MMPYYQERLLAIIEQADYRPLTKKAYRSDVRHLCRHVERIDVPSLQRYGKFLRDTYAPATAARRLHALSILFDQLVAERSLQTNPLARVKKPVSRLTGDLPSRTTTSIVSSRRFVMRLSTPLAFFFCTRGCGFRKPVTYSSRTSTLRAISYSSGVVKAINHVKFRCIMCCVMS